MSDGKETFPWLNYHHLRHFWVIARRPSLTQAARDLNISQSTLSQQLAELEASLGHPLFERNGRRLLLTEQGRLALEHAETIFQTGKELLDCFRRQEGERRVLRIGAMGPLSKNLQYEFIRPLLKRRDIRVLVVAGPLEDLSRRLQDHTLDLVLSNIPLRSDQSQNAFNHLLGEMPIYLAGCMPKRQQTGVFPQWLRDVPLFLPTRQSNVRSDFDLILEDAGVRPDIRAEVDDMALLRLLALSGEGLALVPAIVVHRELKSRILTSTFRVPGVSERFYAITLRRRLPDRRVEEVVREFRKEMVRISKTG